jgi:hypothetical protein
MINLRSIYGSKIFDRKTSYKNVRFIPFVTSILLDIAIAWAIAWAFEISWNYAFIKVYVLLLVYGILKYIISSIVGSLNYRVTIKPALASEIKHYINVFKSNISWDEVGTYDDLLLEAAFDETSSPDMRILAAINYGTIVDAMSLDPHFENRSYKLFCEIVPQVIKSNSQEYV